MSANPYVCEQLTKLFLEKLNLEVPSADTDLLESGFLDSLSFVSLLLVLEQEYGRRVDAEDLDLDRFRSIAKIAEFVTDHAHA
jgi:acyl carrier protein